MYNRLTHNPENLEFCSPCYLCKHPEERPKRNEQKCSMEECDYLKCYEALAKLEDKFAKAERIEIKYAGPHDIKHAIVRYTCQQNTPLAVTSYYVYGEELLTGKLLKCWSWNASMNFEVVEDNFNTHDEAVARMKELRAERKKK